MYLQQTQSKKNLSDFCFFDTVDASLWAKVATPALILSYARFLEDCDHGKSYETSAFKGGLIVIAELYEVVDSAMR